MQCYEVRWKWKNCIIRSGCDTYTKMAASMTVGAGSGKTKLDKHRLKSCKANIVRTDHSNFQLELLRLYNVNGLYS